MSLQNQQHKPTAESVSRLVNFTDAVAAIAITLLVLPLVDIEAPASDESVWDVLQENGGRFFAFGLSFVITLVYWRAHHRMMDGLESFTPTLIALNGLWLMTLVFLQFPTEMLGEGGGARGVLVLYALTLAVLSAASAGMAQYLNQTPGLLQEDRRTRGTATNYVWLDSVYLCFVALVALWQPGIAVWLLFGLIPLGHLENRLATRSAARSAGTPAA